jgi:hypothetical protein
MTPQQALEEARKRYTEGTKYIRAGTNNIVTVQDTILFQIWEGAEQFIIVEVLNGPLYDSQTDKWAEIISTPKSLEDRLVDEFGFEKYGIGPSCHLKLDDLNIFFHYDGNELRSINLFIGSQFIHTNPNNLEDFIKAYLRLF